MTVRPQPSKVKELVVRTFLDLGGAPETLLDLKETVFIGSGRCMARCYRTDDLRAVWPPSDGVIQFYDAEGTLLRTISLLEEKAPPLMVA